MLIGVVPDLALRRRTCYEPLVSTHPDTQGIAAKIDQLAAQGLIRAAVSEQAHEIRHLGNSAAHGDLGDPVTAEDSEEVLHLMGEVLNEVWQSPARAARLAAARKAKKSNP